MKNLLYTFNLKNSLTLFILFFISLNLNAQTRSWTGTVNDDWKTNGNWTDNIVPDKLREPTYFYKKVIGGLLLEVQNQAFKYLEKLEILEAEKKMFNLYAPLK